MYDPTKEREFLRDLASKLQYMAFDMGEKVTHEQPTLSIVVRGTLVRGGRPYGAGECIGEDVMLRSPALRDRRVSVSLTYSEICCLSKHDIDTVAAAHPNSQKQLRFEAFKIAMYRSAQLISNYIKRSDGAIDKHTIFAALGNLGEDVSHEHAEVHTYFHAINGNAKLRGLAREQQVSTDLNVATKAKEAVELTRAAATSARATPPRSPWRPPAAGWGLSDR